MSSIALTIEMMLAMLLLAALFFLAYHVWLRA